MNKKYQVVKVGDRFIIYADGIPVRTPNGFEYSTKSKELADLVCHDMEQFGPDPTAKMSFVMLQAGYCYFARIIDRVELINNTFIGYNPQFDIALAAMEYFESLVYSSPQKMTSTGSIILDPIIYFGPVEKPLNIWNWLSGISTRALITVQTIGGNYNSILVSYNLLREKHMVSVGNLAKGLVYYGKLFQLPQFSDDDTTAKENEVKTFLEKAKRFSSFPDDL